MSVKEWLILYVKHKDLVKRSLVEVKDAGDHVAFLFKDGVVLGYPMETLGLPEGVPGKAIIACLHTPGNVETLIKRWKEFSAHPDLTIILTNPDRNEKVIIHTRTHESVSDGSVEAGIRTMALQAPYASE